MIHDPHGYTAIEHTLPEDLVLPYAPPPWHDFVLVGMRSIRPARKILGRQIKSNLHTNTHHEIEPAVPKILNITPETRRNNKQKVQK
jgi:hypothetical protein